MKNLQAHYEDFLQESRDSALFSVADRLRLEEEVEACKTHFQHLMKSMENGVWQCRRPGFDPWVSKIPWRREWQPTPVFLPGESHGQKSLVGYSP